MKTVNYDKKQLITFFKSQKTATIDALKTKLGTTAAMTVFRKLKEIGYITSCTHRGKYYSLKSIPEYNSNGLYFFENICFSKYGTLTATLEVFVNNSESGYYANELDTVFGVSTKKELLLLIQKKKIDREYMGGKYLYCSYNIQDRKSQIKNRHLKETELVLGYEIKNKSLNEDELKAAIILFYSLLNEKQRRLYAGLESLKFGHGGDKKIAELFCLDIHSVAKGRKEITSNDIDKTDRIRKSGGGRQAIKKKLLK